MASKLVIASIVLIAAGLVLVVIGDTSLRFLTGVATSTPTFRGNFTGGFTGNFTRPTTGTFTGAGRVTTPAIESLTGIALVGAGLLLEVFSIFIRPKPASAPYGAGA